MSLHTLVEQQAKDAGLWFVAQTAPEAYLQQELRRLHAAIEARPAGLDQVTYRYVCGCVATGTPSLPTYCPDHGHSETP